MERISAYLKPHSEPGHEYFNFAPDADHLKPNLIKKIL